MLVKEGMVGFGKRVLCASACGWKWGGEVRVEAVCEALVERRVHAHVEGAADCVVGVEDGSAFWRRAKLCDASYISVEEVEMCI
jgi:hypothetical protein